MSPTSLRRSRPAGPTSGSAATSKHPHIRAQTHRASTLYTEVDVLLTGLVDGRPVYLPPTLLVGESGGDKSRLAHRFAELPKIGLHRFDRTGSSDNAFGGAPRNGSRGRALLPFPERKMCAPTQIPYVQSDVDLSHIGYILAANHDKALPAPLKDRLRIIRLSLPTIDDLLRSSPAGSSPTSPKSAVAACAACAPSKGGSWPIENRTRGTNMTDAIEIVI